MLANYRIELYRSLGAVLLIAGLHLSACSSTKSREPTQSRADQVSPEPTGKPSAVVAESPESPKPDNPPDPDAVAGQTVWRFDSEKVAHVPAGIELNETAGAGTPAKWKVVPEPTAPSQPHAFGIVESANRGQTFNLALIEKPSLADLELSVKVKATKGSEDQGGGPVWRAADADNYYISRWNPLENNYRVYVVKKGHRRRIASTKVDLPADQWHTIRVIMRGSRIETWINGGHHLQVDDHTFTKAGKVGLWTKADAVTLFDDFTVQPAEE